MVWKLNHGAGTDQTLGRELRAASAFARPALWHLRWPWVVLTGDAHTEATRGWSMSLSRFDVSSSVSAAAKGMLMQYECAGFEVATWCRITRLVRSCAGNKLRFFSLFCRRSLYSRYHRAPPGFYR